MSGVSSKKPVFVASPAGVDRARLAKLAECAPTALGLFAETGQLLAQNEAARATFGDASLAQILGSPERVRELFETVRDTGKLRGETELFTLGGKGWFLVCASATADPGSGAFAVSLSAEDLSERVRADRAKDEFISIVNHELRTPLTAIRGAVGLLANDVVDGTAQRAELFDIAWDNVLRLGRLVDDLLDAQRLRLGAVHLVLTQMEIAPLVRETLELLELTAEQAQITLEMAEPAPPVLVRADPGRLLQALSNLVGNAIKHAPAGSTVAVEVTEVGPRVRVAVRDEGSGVPEAFVAHLFVPFSQADSTDARARGGAGLGLYIVRTLVDAHGGIVGYEPSPSGGSVFFFELPSSGRADPAAPEPDPAFEPAFEPAAAPEPDPVSEPEPLAGAVAAGRAIS
ncbi:MAG: ATP-binding protein [Polyangiaceae bacterium]